jgi:regulator of protease activity HflC (stomatin/prohibitin superfamily)
VSSEGTVIVGGIAVLCFGVLGSCAAWPQYKVYSQRLDGEASLAAAESTRKIAVLEAQAKLDSASKLSDAEIARARGVAEANKIIGESLKGNDAYLRYLWIQTLESGKNDTIYVPTEANLPILEAARKAPVPPPPPAPVEEEK